MKVVRLARPMRSFIEQQNSPNTQDAYRRDLTTWSEWSVDKPFTVDTAVAFKTWLLSHYAPASARRIFSTTRCFYDWMRKHGKLEVNPFEAVKAPQRADSAPNVPTDVQVERILRAIDRESPSGKRHYAIMTLLLCGLRASEVCDLRVEDWQYDETTKATFVRVIGKGMKERRVPLTEEARRALTDHDLEILRMRRTARREDNDWLIEDVFPGRPITRKQVAYVCDKYGKLAGVRGFSPHSFRHHYGTRLYRVTRDVLGVGRLMGHSKPETTQRYARLDLADLVETARLDPRAGIDKGEYDAECEAG